MSGERRSKGSDKRLAQRARRWVYFHLLILLLIMGFIVPGVFFLLQKSHARTQMQAPPWIKEESTSPSVKARFDLLKGNAETERFMRTLKEELLWLEKFDSLDEAQDNLSAWMDFYNNYYLHSALGYRSPQEYEQLYRAENLEKAA